MKCVVCGKGGMRGPCEACMKSLEAAEDRGTVTLEQYTLIAWAAKRAIYFERKRNGRSV